MILLRSGMTFETKVVDVKDKSTDREEIQLEVEIVTPQKPEFKNSDEVNSNTIKYNNLIPALDAEPKPQKSCPIQAKVPSPQYPQ